MAAPWRVAYVRSRQEKQLARHLLHQAVPYFLPQREKRARRAGRNQVSYLPLFPGYVFFRGGHRERRTALESNLLVSLLEVEDQERLCLELDQVWRLTSAGVLLVPHPYLEVGDEVEVLDGPFAGLSGKVLRKKGRFRLVVSVTFVRRSVAAEFDREILAPVAEPRSAHRPGAGWA